MTVVGKISKFYESHSIVLVKKIRNKGLGRMWGYRARGLSGVSTASIGNDEVVLFNKLCSMRNANVVFTVGHGFGLSSIAFAEGNKAKCLSIDNWSHNQQPELGYPLAEKLMSEYSNIIVYTGMSPKDTAAAMTSIGESKIDIVFIDGDHSDAACLADFEGLRPYVDESSLILFHNANATQTAIASIWEDFGSKVFTDNHMLFTWGPTQILYNRESNPNIHEYLRDYGYVWHDWRRWLTHINRNPDIRQSYLHRITRKIFG